jgi:ABC-type antimicrobial peptide transport system permease subunit
LAGFYPSIVLSRYKAVDALKSKVTKIGSGSISLRRSLVVFQFVIAQALIIGTLIIVRQMDFFMHQPVGFDKDAIINITLPQDSTALTNRNYLRNQILAINGVLNASYSSNTPLDENRNQWSNFVYNRALENTDFYTIVKATDHEFLDTYKIPLVAGRNISSLKATTEFLVNETLLKKLGITDPEEALNKEIVLWESKKGPIVGVMKDFQDHSFKDEISSVILLPEKGLYGQIGIKLSSKESSTALSDIEKIWNEIFPDYVFEYHFLDDKIASIYEQEKRLSNLYTLAAGIAIFLSSLGLFGLASFMIMQRVKEAGIRKVLGATKENIVYLFSREFIILIAIAFCIASPVAWYFMNNWLEEYAYRIDIGWAVFLISGIATLAIALTTVGYQASRVANSSPLKSLRNE